MTPERYNTILSQAQGVSSKIGDIPDNGACSIIQERIRSLTDNHAVLKTFSSEILLDMNKIRKARRAIALTRQTLFKEALGSEEIRSVPGSQDLKKELAAQKVSQQDEQLQNHDEQLDDLETLGLVIKNQLDSVSTSISNLRKEWEMVETQRRAETAMDKIRRVREAVESDVRSGVLEVEKERGSDGVSGNQIPEPRMETKGPQSVNVDELLEGLGVPQK